MIKNLKVIKKNLTALTLACTMVFMSGCSKEHNEHDQVESNYSTIYMTEYDSTNHNLYWDEKTQSEFENIPNDIIAIKEIKDDILYAASYHAIGYEAAMKNKTKNEAIKNNPEYGQNEAFSAGYDLGKADKFLKKANEEQKTYVSIRAGIDEKTAATEANYYPLEELTVISYNGKNAIVREYNEENIRIGNYEDLLGQDMSAYIGQEFQATSLRQFATENVDTLQDSIYMVSNDYRYIAEITTATMNQVNINNTSKIR